MREGGVDAVTERGVWQKGKRKKKRKRKKKSGERRGKNTSPKEEQSFDSICPLEVRVAAARVKQ